MTIVERRVTNRATKEPMNSGDSVHRSSRESGDGTAPVVRKERAKLDGADEKVASDGRGMQGGESSLGSVAKRMACERASASEIANKRMVGSSTAYRGDLLSPIRRSREQVRRGSTDTMIVLLQVHSRLQCGSLRRRCDRTRRRPPRPTCFAAPHSTGAPSGTRSTADQMDIRQPAAQFAHPPHSRRAAAVRETIQAATRSLWQHAGSWPHLLSPPALARSTPVLRAVQAATASQSPDARNGAPRAAAPVESWISLTPPVRLQGRCRACPSCTSRCAESCRESRRRVSGCSAPAARAFRISSCSK